MALFVGITYNLLTKFYNILGLKEIKFMNMMRFEMTYSKKNAWGTRYVERKRVVAFMEKHDIKSFNFESVLDIGCGYGYLCKELAKTIPLVIGIDISGKAIKEASKGHSRAIFLKMNILDFDCGRFDLVIANSVLPYLTSRQREKAMKIIKKMKPKKLIIC